MRLLELVAEHGPRWQTIGAALGRMPEACRDRFRETRLGAERRSGKWTPEEEARLADIVPAAQAAAQVCKVVRCTGSWGFATLGFRHKDTRFLKGRRAWQDGDSRKEVCHGRRALQK